MSIEHQAPAVAEPDESGAVLVDELLAELDAGRTGPLAEFVRAYVRRAPPPLRTEHAVPELAAQVRGVFAFVNERPPGELAVRAYNPDPERDGWSASGSVVIKSLASKENPRADLLALMSAATSGKSAA